MTCSHAGLFGGVSDRIPTETAISQKEEYTGSWKGNSAGALTSGEAGSRGSVSERPGVLGAVSSVFLYDQVGAALVSSKMTSVPSSQPLP